MTTTENETQSAVAVAAEAGTPPAADKTGPTKSASRKKSVAKKKTKSGKAAKKATGKRGSARPGKGATILEMIRRAKGATLAEIMGITGWKAHSVRGFISTAGKKHGVKIDSSRNETGERVYRSK